MLTIFAGNVRRTERRGILLLLAIPLTVMLVSVDKYAQKGADQKWNRYSTSYKKNHDYRSLKALVKLLKVGMSQSQVEDLLGPSVYSPIEGQHYYATDVQARHGGVMGLVVEYRKWKRNKYPEVILTGKLESFSFGPIRE